MTDVWFPPQRPDRPWGPASDSVPTHKANAGGETKHFFIVKKCVDLYLRLGLPSGSEAFFVNDSEQGTFLR